MAKQTPKITEYENGNTISLGDNVLVSRTMTPVDNDNDGQPIFAWRVYILVPVKDGIHPIHKTPTSEKEVWMPHGEAFTKEEALAAAKKLA